MFNFLPYSAPFSPLVYIWGRKSGKEMKIGEKVTNFLPLFVDYTRKPERSYKELRAFPLCC
jgi:hypothetical protein